jgi:hypothetical protein
METPVKLNFRATIHRDGTEPFTVTCIGRVGWCILSLIRAGKRGCTPIDRPAPRWRLGSLLIREPSMAECSRA